MGDGGVNELAVSTEDNVSGAAPVGLKGSDGFRLDTHTRVRTKRVDELEYAVLGCCCCCYCLLLVLVKCPELVLSFLGP